MENTKLEKGTYANFKTYFDKDFTVWNGQPEIPNTTPDEVFCKDRLASPPADCAKNQDM